MKDNSFERKHVNSGKQMYATAVSFSASAGEVKVVDPSNNGAM